MSTLDHVKVNAKAYAALVVAVATGALGIYGPDTDVGKGLTLLVAVAGAVAVWATRNGGTDPDAEYDEPADPEPDAAPGSD